MSEPEYDPLNPLNVPVLGQIAAGVLLLVMLGCAIKLTLASPSNPEPWPVEIDFIIVATTGAIAGILCGKDHPLLGLICGVVSGLGGFGSAYLYCQSFVGGGKIVVVCCALGAVPGIVAFYWLRSFSDAGPKRASNEVDRIEEDGYRFASERLSQWQSTAEEAHS